MRRASTDPSAQNGKSGIAQPLLSGIVAAVTGFASTFPIVLAGLSAAGASDAQAASGLLSICVLAGFLGIVMGVRYRVPLTFAWSTPGAALLVASGSVTGGFDEVVGAFVVAAVLLVLTGLWPVLGRLVGRIPRPLATAMLAGILFPICLAPVTAAVESPLLALPVIAVWLLLLRLAPRWAVPVSISLAVGLMIATNSAALTGIPLAPRLEFVEPEFEIGTMVGIGVPLYVVTMAGQNVPGLAVLHTFGYETHARVALTGSGAASALGALLGGLPVNLAALSAALIAGPDASPRQEKRWIAAVSAGVSYLVLGVLAGAATALVSAASPLLIQGVAGLALLGAFVSAVIGAVEDPALRIPAAATLLITASGIAVAGIGSAFWGLLVGLLAAPWLSRGRAAR